ncbi:30S ribosomal protein S6 [Candidatus Berkelbacteria bacterium]|nr:30S ribosomal protein S6 [Candidatus Berkelbacteria bacterium]MBI2588120.1 30S ribosomal protein S6 [Candidatus Berkelbacteria bacterium]MBI4029695.1 30S ribosomal protein S6 [Candidatus Berkelbacteria bacterium]
MSYQITLITPKEENVAAALLEIEKLNGRIEKQQSLGVKKLAYPLKKETEGHLASIFFEMEPQNLKRLHERLLLLPSILRYLIAKNKKIQISAETEEEKVALPALLLKKEKVVEKKEGSAEKVTEKERLQKLEERLEEILKE